MSVYWDPKQKWTVKIMSSENHDQVQENAHESECQGVVELSPDQLAGHYEKYVTYFGIVILRTSATWEAS